MEIDYKKKIKRCERLGANKFQKVVFLVEHLKYKFIKKCMPNFLVHYDKRCDKRRDKALKKATTEEERKKIINNYRRQKMIVRKEFNREQNRNYHMDPNKPTEILHYLNWNKSVHKKSLIKNAIVITGLGVASVLGFTPAIPFLVMELGSAFINFQCVNIQNCNIYRFKQKEASLKRLEEKKNKKSVEAYSQAAKVVNRSMEQTDKIPSIDEIIANVQTQEELVQLRNLVQQTLADNKQAIEQKQAHIGGEK